MSRYIENYCVGCLQGCISCGRNRDYEIVECDICGKTITDEYDFNEHEGKDYCDKCYDKMLEEEEEKSVHEHNLLHKIIETMESEVDE